MSARQKRIRGTKHHRIDSKGRVALPAQWRDCFSSEIFIQRAKYLGVEMLRIMTEQALNRFYDQIESMGWDPATKNAMTGMLDSQTEELKLNEQGKILIPKQVCDRQGFQAGAELALVARGDLVEIYTQENHNKMLELQEDAIRESDKSINAFGLNG